MKPEPAKLRVCHSPECRGVIGSRVLETKRIGNDVLMGSVPPMGNASQSMNGGSARSTSQAEQRVGTVNI